MKKYIIAFALCLACFSLSAQQTIYVIDNVTVEKFDGSQLQGKIIKNYHISTQGSGKKAVTVHAITTAPATTTVYGIPNPPESIRIQDISAGMDSLSVSFPKIKVRQTDPNAEAPLFIIDGGAPVGEEALKNLDPSKIKSMSVFKDAETMMKYGTSGGVIFIETKKPAAE